ncbi:MAG: hypothetical protein QXS54_11260 [Candidatus Methanomethylicaceae archaeon]
MTALKEIELRNQNLTTYRSTLYERLERMANENLRDAIDSGAYTLPEIKSMKMFEMLRLASDIDLISLYIKSDIIQEIEEHGLYAVHPGGYKTPEEAFYNEAGLSKSELSNIKNLVQIIFPWLQKYIQVDPIVLWQKRSNLREAVPYLLGLITGETSSDNVRRFLEERSDMPVIEVAKEILDMVENETNRNLREYFRPKERIQSYMIKNSKSNRRVFVAVVDDDNAQRISSSNLFDIVFLNGNTRLSDIKELEEII